MPTDPKARRRRINAVRDILMEDKAPQDQMEVVERLAEKGIHATQSSVSRDLRHLGAMRLEEGYRIPSWFQEEESPFRRVLGFLVKAQILGPHMILLATQPGAGNIVAEAIEASDWEDIDGMVAGYSSVLLLTQHKFFQDLVFARLKWFLDTEYGEGEHDALPAPEKPPGAGGPEGPPRSG
jgi:transcriptional regulator of arginine metabolism